MSEPRFVKALHDFSEAIIDAYGANDHLWLVRRARYFLAECRKYESSPPVGADDIVNDELTISDELRAKLEAAIVEGERLSPSVIPKEARWAYRAVPNEPAVACRTTDTAGRRVTCFFSINAGNGLDGITVATLCAEALQHVEDSRT